MGEMKWSVAPNFFVQDVVTTANYYRDKLGFSYDRVYGDPPAFCIVCRRGAAIMLRRLHAGLPRPNGSMDPTGEAWDAYVYVDDANAIYEEFKRSGVKIARQICDQPYGCRDFDIEDMNGYRLCFGQDLG